MRIGLNDIDDHIAQEVQHRLTAPENDFLRANIYWGGFIRQRHQRDPSEDEKRAFELHKRRKGHNWKSVGLYIGGATLPPVIGFLMGAGAFEMFHSDSFSWFMLLSTWAAGTGGSFWLGRKMRKPALHRSVTYAEMKAVFPLLSLTRAERIYCDTLMLLAQIQAEPEAEKTMRDTLRQLNALLERSRQLEQRRIGLIPMLGANVISELEAEYGALGRRIDATTDSIARESLKHSLQMCAARLENARSFSKGVERINAQQEAIVQTLASALSALARMQLTPETHTPIAAQEIAETVAQLNLQTNAVEQAVQEVITLQAQ